MLLPYRMHHFNFNGCISINILYFVSGLTRATAYNAHASKQAGVLIQSVLHQSLHLCDRWHEYAGEYTWHRHAST